MTMSLLESVQRIADAVLFEGYVLYPYRASAAKNQYRWQFGVVARRAPREDGEPWFAQTECLVIASPTAVVQPSLSVRVRFLRPRASNTQETQNGRPWLEGVPCSIDVPSIPLDPLPATVVLALPDAGIAARLLLHAEASGTFIKLRLRLENLEPWSDQFDQQRDAMLRHSLVGTHLLLAIEGATFESMLEPSDAAQPFVARCRNQYTWPVLVGDRTQRNLMLSSPIVLYDFPAVANESRGDLCDAAEIDEILTLRILTMTDEEKWEARSTDPRAREILDRIEAMHPAEVAALHGTIRSADFFNPPGTRSPDAAFVLVNGQRVERGCQVRLRPNRRADAMDMFLRDQVATVAGVYRDVDDRTYVAVTVDADPAASLHESFGRFFYFDPAEVEPITTAEHV
jgi:hypothetical protein